MKKGTILTNTWYSMYPLMFKVVEDSDDDTIVKVVQINSTLGIESKCCEPGWVTLVPNPEHELSVSYFIDTTKPDYKVWNGVHIFCRDPYAQSGESV